MRKFVSQRAQLIRSYYAGIGKLGVIYPAAILVSIGVGLVQLGIVFYAKDILKLSASSVGMLAATWAVAYAVSCIFLRPLLDKVFPRYLMMGATLLMFCFLYLVTLTSSPHWVFLYYACFGASMALFWSPTMGWLSMESEGKQLNRLLSLFNLSWGVGAIVSPYLSGWLYEKEAVLPLRLGSIIFLVVSAFIAGAAMALPRVRSDLVRGSSPGAEGGEDRSSTCRFPAWVGLWACFFGMGVLYTVFPLSGRSELGLTEKAVGGLLLFFSLFNLLGHFLLGRTTFWHFRLTPMLGALIWRSLAFAGLIWASTMMPLLVLMAVMGLTTSLCYAASVFHGSSGSVNRAKRMATHETLLASGLVMGSVCGGAVYQALSASVVYVLTVLVLLAAMIVQVFLHRRMNAERSKEPDTETLLPPLKSDNV